MYVLGALSAGAIVAAVLVVGPAPASQSTVTRTATVAQGVVQSTVSGSGNLQPASQLDLGFKTSGTVTGIYVSQGQHVTEGELIASLDPQSAEVTLEQAKATLQSAEASLAREEETDGESSGQGSSGGASAAAASFTSAHAAAAGEATQTGGRGAPTTTTTTPSTTTPATTTPSSTTTTTTTTPTSTTPTSTTPSSTTAPTSSGKSRSSERSSSEEESSSSSSSKSSSLSTATREANIASARAAVKSDRLNVRSDEEALQDTNLYAPQSGTIASLSGQVGEVVSGGGTTRAKSSSSSESSSTGASGRGASATASSASSSTGTGSSSSTFAVLTDLSSMQLVVPLSESEVGSVRDGQVATVTVEALEGRKLAAHVSEISILSTSNSGVVSYDVTFQLDQMTPGIRPGMSATAEVVVKQAEGINVPTSAISADSVTVLKNGKRTTHRVVTGLAGNSTTIILSGLSAGETVVLPSTSTTSSSRSALSGLRSSTRGLTGVGGLGGGGAGAFAGGGAAFFRGGG